MLLYYCVQLLDLYADFYGTQTAYLHRLDYTVDQRAHLYGVRQLYVPLKRTIYSADHVTSVQNVAAQTLHSRL